ncbi:MAG: hypothetical protein GKR95_01525 [Gammaproteobacteria bacterium]|nr:hypothetical protein [Gammaproteobacteria bacterium]
MDIVPWTENLLATEGTGVCAGFAGIQSGRWSTLGVSKKHHHLTPSPYNSLTESRVSDPLELQTRPGKG